MSIIRTDPSGEQTSGLDAIVALLVQEMADRPDCGPVNYELAFSAQEAESIVEYMESAGLNEVVHSNFKFTPEGYNTEIDVHVIMGRNCEKGGVANG